MTEAEYQNKLEELEQRIERLEKIFSDPANIREKAKVVSPKEFLLQRNLRSEIQKALALGYYLENIEGVSSFNVADLEAVFRAAKEKLPKNLNDAVNKNVAKGFLMESKEKKNSKKAWCLTATGESQIDR